jgi:hypothetical protein
MVDFDHVPTPKEVKNRRSVVNPVDYYWAVLAEQACEYVATQQRRAQREAELFEQFGPLLDAAAEQMADDLDLDPDDDHRPDGGAAVAGPQSPETPATPPEPGAEDTQAGTGGEA